MWSTHDPEQVRKLHRIARSAAMRTLSSSAIPNLADDVASQAVYEYWLKVDGGEKIENPEAMVTTIAQRRAFDAQRKWEVRRHEPIPGVADIEESTVIHPALIAEREAMPSTLTIKAWVQGVILSGGGDDTDVALALRSWFEAIEPADLADEFGHATKTVQNRLSKSRRLVEDAAARGDTPLTDGS